MPKRPYQHDFYASCRRVRDPQSRLKIAEKVHYILDEHLEEDPSGFLCLDIGCASGTITSSLTSRFGQIIGIDIDEAALRSGRGGEGKNLDLVRSDAVQAPFPDGSFDFILCLQVYEHVPDDTALMHEINRLLRPGGYVLFSGPNKLFPVEPHYYLPFLHWLPQRWADRYLQIVHMGTHYYEKSRTYWSLRRMMWPLQITELSPEILIFKARNALPRALVSFLKHFPRAIWRILLPFFPNYNWLLRKPGGSNRDAAASMSDPMTSRDQHS